MCLNNVFKINGALRYSYPGTTQKPPCRQCPLKSLGAEHVNPAVEFNPLNFEIFACIAFSLFSPTICSDFTPKALTKLKERLKPGFSGEGFRFPSLKNPPCSLGSGSNKKQEGDYFQGPGQMWPKSLKNRMQETGALKSKP